MTQRRLQVLTFFDGVNQSAPPRWDRRLEKQVLAHKSGEAAVSVQGMTMDMGGIKKPLLPPQCTAGSGMLRQGALCSPLNFFTKSQR